MYNEKNLEEALELCHDIDVYYEKDQKKKRGTASLGNRSMELYYQDMAAFAAVPQKKEKTVFGRFLNEAASVLICLVIAYGAARFITDFLVQPTKVDGISMESTLYDGDVLLIDRLSYRLHDPRRYDVVVFPFSVKEHYVKRIIGLPGETVQIHDGVIYINSSRLNEQYGNEPIEDAGIAQSEILLGEDEYFMMGDNRNHSIDSRSIYVGPVEGKKIMGRVALRLYPFENTHKIK